MKIIIRGLVMVIVCGLVSTATAPAAHAQGGYKTYPGYYGRTPSPSYYDLGTEADRDTYMRPWPYYTPPPDRYGANSPQPYPYGYYGTNPAYGYYYGGPFIQGHYGQYGRRGFRMGWW